MDGTLIVWNLKNWNPLHRISFASAQPRPVDVDFQFSPNGKSIAASADNEIKLYNTDTGTPLSSLGRGARVAFRHDKKQIAHSSGVRDVQLVEIPSGTAIQTLTGHRGRVTCLAFSPDGKSLAVGNVTSGVIKLWDLPSLAENRTSGNGAATDKHAPLGDRKATQADLVEVQRLASDNPLHFENRPILHFDVSRSFLFGQQVVTIARKPDGSAIKTLKQTHSPVWRPQGEQFAYFRESQQGGRESLWVASLEGAARELLTAEENQFLRWYPAWSPDGNRLAVLSVQATNENVDRVEDVKFEVLVVDLASGDIKQKCPFPAGVIEAAPLSPPSVFKWSPSGKYVLISWESSVVVDVQRNRSIQITDGYSVAEWSPDGESVLFFSFSDRDTPQGRLKGLYRRSLSENSSQLIADRDELSSLNLLEVPGMFRLKLILSATGQYVALVAGAVHEYANVTEIRVYRWDEHTEFDLDSPIRTWSLESELPIQLQWSPDDTHLAVIMMKDWSDLTVEMLRLSDGARTKVSDIHFNPQEEGVGGLNFIGFGKFLSWSN
jgi:WD40 repeat protein